jgi:hypothetical protein
VNRVILIFAFLIVCVRSSAQESNLLEQIIREEQKRRGVNALPPGPARITGQLVNRKGEPLRNVDIKVKYPDGKQRDADNFRSREDGHFLVYIFREDQAWAELEIISGKKILGRIRYDHISPGRNIGFPTDKVVVGKK